MTTSKQRPSMAIARTDSLTFQQCQGPAFIQAVNRAANLKILAALKSGKLRIVEPPKPTQTMPIASYTPRMDVIDDPSSPNLSAIFEIPGIKTENIKLYIGDGALFLYGERRAPYPTRVEPLSENPIAPINALTLGDKMDEDTRVKIRVQEICFGTFQRTVPIPKGVKMQDIHANLSDGLLTVTFPRSPVHTVDEIPRSSRPHKSNSSSPPMSMVAAGTASQ
ncbi:hypothetical protein CVT25_010354 [Psilocybe cyanescens]|uniref:SHSP domain-containing protein n=1 Tax=Psilocybe cyanescens TaxID=93625 RepID=A0A409XP62_PSICY|nr:hypothetical protein CVT25_010354 [Psilocybe cyanescens]